LSTDFKPYVTRLIVVLVISIAAAFLINEGAYLLQRDKTDRPPRTVELLIPAGTAERVAQGEAAPGIPEKMTFVVGDVLEVRNEDSVDHQLGPVWVPAGSTGKLVLKDANRYAYSCSFVPSRYLGLDVRQGPVFSDRLVGLALAAPTIAVLVFIYSLLIFPVKTRQKNAEGGA